MISTGTLSPNVRASPEAGSNDCSMSARAIRPPIECATMAMGPAEGHRSRVSTLARTSGKRLAIGHTAITLLVYVSSYGLKRVSNEALDLT